MSDSDPTNDPSSGQAQPGQTQPGWYPDPGTGQLRWYDGQQWGEFQQAAAPAAGGGVADPKGPASLAHYLGAGILFLTCWGGWIGPLIIYAGQGKNDPFVKDQAAEALNFQITIAIAAVVASLLVLVIIGFVLLPIIYLAGVIFGVMGGMAASRGEWYRYPFSIKFVKA